MLLLGYLTDTKIFQMGDWNEHWSTEVCKLLDMSSQKYREIFRVLLGFRGCISHKQHRTRHIWEARTHFHLASAPYLLHLHSYFSPHNLSLFPRLLPPSTFQGKYYKYSFKQVFFAHFGCLWRPVVMALSRSIFLKNRTWTSWGMVSFSTEKSLFRNKTEQNKPPPKSSLSLKCPRPPAIFFSTTHSSIDLMASLGKSVELPRNFNIELWLSDLCTPVQSVGGKTETWTGFYISELQFQHS